MMFSLLIVGLPAIAAVPLVIGVPAVAFSHAVAFLTAVSGFTVADVPALAGILFVAESLVRTRCCLKALHWNLVLLTLSGSGVHVPCNMRGQVNARQTIEAL
jgi:hypothetical protein